ncbi:MAG: hypothetical protein PHN42_05760 [Bacilli bacterium]|nr:hypothetical protein [Bacilli bacterium]
MRKYYLFIIRDEYYNKYRYKQNILYKALFYLYKTNEYDLSHGLYLYEKICNVFSVKLLNNYIKNKYETEIISKKIIKLNSIIEKTIIQINYSCVIVISNMNIPLIFKTLNIYNKKIFVCDFINQDYFWLNSQLSEFYQKHTYNKIGG